MLAGAAAFTFDVPVLAQRKDDPLLRELRRQLRAGVREMRGARPGEGARAVSAALAFAAAYGKAVDLDAQFRVVLRRAGKARLTDPEIEPAHILGILRDHGQSDVRLPPLADLTMRRKVYDALVAGGLTPLVEREARSFAEASVELDRLNGVFRPVINNHCQPLMDNITIWSAMVSIACSPPSVATGVGSAACTVAAGALAGMILRYYIDC